MSFGRLILAFLIIIMMPLATTEIGTDGWISSLMEEPLKAAGHHPGWVLVYTSAIMMVLRFFAVSCVLIALVSILRPARWAEALRKRGWWGPALAMSGALGRRDAAK